MIRRADGTLYFTDEEIAREAEFVRRRTALWKKVEAATEKWAATLDPKDRDQIIVENDKFHEAMQKLHLEFADMGEAEVVDEKDVK